MENMFDIRFSFEQHTKEQVIVKFSNKQGGAYNVFSYHWQCFAWAAIIGFLWDERRALQPPIADKPFSLKTMQCNNGEKIAQALICLCIAKAGSLDIVKNPADAIEMINEYANGGFYHIMKLVENGENSFNDLEKVKQEIFGRNYNENYAQETISRSVLQSIPQIETENIQESGKQSVIEELGQESVQTVLSDRWKHSEKKELKDLYAQGLTIEQLAKYFQKTEFSTKECLQKLGVL